MILYSSIVSDFIDDIHNNKIVSILENTKKANCMKKQQIQENYHGKIY